MDVVGDRTLYSTFVGLAVHEPHREWLRYEREDRQLFRWTFAEFLGSVHRAASLLESLGIGLGDAFNLHITNHPAYPQLILAASYLGAIAVPTNPASTIDELDYVIGHSESRVIFTDARGLEVATVVAEHQPIRHVVFCDTGGERPTGVPTYEEELTRQPATPPQGAGAADRVVQLLYTSGTTARPKGVMLTNACLLFGAEVFRGATALRPDDRHLIALPLFHAAAQCHALWPSLVAGASVALVPRFSASRFFEQAIEHDCTVAALFGAPLRMLLQQPERPTDQQHRLRNVTFAQSLTPSQYETWHHRFGAPLQQLWGMTETAGLPLMSPLTGDRRLLAMGRPVVGYEVRVIDEAGREAGPGEQGQIVVRGVPGRTMMLGYLNDPVATAKTLRQEPDGVWLLSGDTVRVELDGFISFVDRGRDVIKRAGENISSTEVESVLLDCPGVVDACVVGVPDPVRDEAVVAVVVARSGVVLTAEIVRAHCAGTLAPFKVPERVVFVESLPRTSVGKIQKQIVRERLSAERGEAGV